MLLKFPLSLESKLAAMEREKGIKFVRSFYRCDEYQARKIYELWKKEYMKAKVRL